MEDTDLRVCQWEWPSILVLITDRHRAGNYGLAKAKNFLDRPYILLMSVK